MQIANWAPADISSACEIAANDRTGTEVLVGVELPPATDGGRFTKVTDRKLFVIERQEHVSASRQINRADPTEALRSSPDASVSSGSPSRCCLAPMPLVCDTASTTRDSVGPDCRIVAMRKYAAGRSPALAAHREHNRATGRRAERPHGRRDRYRRAPGVDHGRRHRPGARAGPDVTRSVRKQPRSAGACALRSWLLRFESGNRIVHRTQAGSAGKWREIVGVGRRGKLVSACDSVCHALLYGRED